MKTISLNRVENALSESEMKLVKGGIDPLEEPKDLTVEESACNKLANGDACSYTDNAMQVHKGTCSEGVNGTLTCG